ncbi:helix-turn-helix domain-containing protein [Streptococcus halichoeri]|uniref:helix-turn-helix domain-containing protein n=1 Tax=Streptococcus halichoeri TaxID=254785 RepID=UPI00135B9849|nr:helix-turn-helix domain-containing protein [Streptococcus halichoeri]
MRNYSLGDLLRETRVSKQITLDDLERKTGISSHYLLAMELNQFKIIPTNDIDYFLRVYGQEVGLDFDLLKARYMQQTRMKKVSDHPSVTEIVEEKLSKQHAYSEPDLPHSDLSHSHFQNAKNTYKVSYSHKKPYKPYKTANEPEFLAAKPHSRKKSHHERLSRQQVLEKKSKPFLSGLLLGLLTLLVFSLILFAVWKQFGKSHVSPQAQKTVQETADDRYLKDNSTSLSSSKNHKPKLVLVPQEDNLGVTVKGAKEQPEITVTLKEGDSSWISLTSSDIAETGMTLTKETPSYSAVLPAQTKQSILTLGITQGMEVTVDGQVVDLSGLANTATNYITFTFED